ncbi:MAG: mandelate racemase/muconate lactonizing enzyme family protein, partial [Verrucomicrobiia bacterium]
GPFLSRKVFTSPVIIESLDLFERDGTWFVRARSTDGAEGWAVSHDSKMPLYFPIFLKVIAPHMVGKDARDIDRLVDTVFLTGANYKMQGQPFWVPIASAEFAILDLLGRIANQPVGELLGGIRRKQIPLYIANNHRTHGPEESLKRIVESVESIDAKAVKFKLGGRMKVIDEVPHRTERLIPMVADALGDRCTLYADANSSYVSTDRAIAIGRLLQKNGFSFYEEPCPFDYLEETKRVADALEIPIAWGEQESSQWRFKWMIENSGVQIPQPDIIYYGGLIRSLRIAKMAEERGLDCTPHISGGGLGFIYMAIYASCCPNPGPFQEYKGVNRRFPWESPGVDFKIEKGVMPAPIGPGIGVDIDPDFLEGARSVHI